MIYTPPKVIWYSHKYTHNFSFSPPDHWGKGVGRGSLLCRGVGTRRGWRCLPLLQPPQHEQEERRAHTDDGRRCSTPCVRGFWKQWGKIPIRVGGKIPNSSGRNSYGRISSGRNLWAVDRVRIGAAGWQDHLERPLCLARPQHRHHLPLGKRRGRSCHKRRSSEQGILENETWVSSYQWNLRM